MNKKIIIILIIISAFLLSGSYSETIQKQLDIAENSGLSNILSDETVEFLKKIGIENISYEKLSSLNFKDIFIMLSESISSKIKEPFIAIFSITACTIICSVIDNFYETSSQSGKIINAVAILSVYSIFIFPMKKVLEYSCSVIKECSDFMLGFVPIYSSAIIASGNLNSAIGFRALMLNTVTIISKISGEIITPLICIYLAMCITTSVCDINIGEISKSIKNFAVWILTFSSTVFSGILGFGTLISSTGDIAFSKTAKLFIGTAVPIVGGTVSDALSTLKSCLEVTKNVLGTYAIVVIAAIFLPSAISLLSWKISLSISSGIGDILGNKNFSAILSSVSSVMGIMLALVVITAVMFIFAVGIMLKIGG